MPTRQSFQLGTSAVYYISSSNETNYLEVKRADWCHAALLHTTNTVQGIVSDERSSRTHSTVRRERMSELLLQEFISEWPRLAYSQLSAIDYDS